MALFKKLFNPAADEGDYLVDETDAAALPAESEVSAAEEGQLAVDVFQDKNNVYVQSTIAGVKPEDLDISISSDTVTVKGQRQRQQEIAEEDFFYRECYWGGFSRTLPLPVEIDVDKAEAELKDGVLTMTLPKTSSAKTKKVKVKSEE